MMLNKQAIDMENDLKKFSASKSYFFISLSMSLSLSLSLSLSVTLCVFNKKIISVYPPMSVCLSLCFFLCIYIFVCLSF